jgi:hypothetical protein
MDRRDTKDIMNIGKDIAMGTTTNTRITLDRHDWKDIVKDYQERPQRRHHEHKDNQEQAR